MKYKNKEERKMKKKRKKYKRKSKIGKTRFKTIKKSLCEIFHT